MEYDELVQRLQGEVRAAKGLERFTANSLLDLVWRIETGAHRMVDEGRTEDVGLAVQNLRRALAEMEVAKERLGFAEFREETVSRAFSSLCPGLWPFC